jgi:hypothetical protein
MTRTLPTDDATATRIPKGAHVKITIPVTVEIDPAAWAAEYGLAGEAEAVADIHESMRQAAPGLAQGIVVTWPVLRDLATITAGTIYGPDDAADAVAGLVYAYGLDTVSSHVRRATHVAADQVIADTARKAIAAQKFDPADPAPVAVVFSAYDYENGWFLDNDTATVTFADGSTDTIEIDENLDALNSALNADGACGPESSLAVRLSDGTTEYGDYAGDTEAIVAGWIRAYKPTEAHA